MTHSHSFNWRPRRFRAYVTIRYWANKDEYDGYGQQQPHTFDEYVRANLPVLKQEYRAKLRTKRRLSV